MSANLAFHILVLVLVAVAMGLSLAHALEFPGKLRLPRENYIATQAIYYPGFTYGGLFGEFGGMLGLTGLLFALPPASTGFWWASGALALMIAAHAVYWLMTHPVNGFWLKDTELSGLGAAFFTKAKEKSADWTQLRDTWEYSHVVRAVLQMAAFIAAALSLAFRAETGSP
jgi:hypothetical protein